MKKIPKYIREEKEEMPGWRIKEDKIEILICMECGYTWKSDEGRQCVMCNSKNNIEL